MRHITPESGVILVRRASEYDPKVKPIDECEEARLTANSCAKPEFLHKYENVRDIKEHPSGVVEFIYDMPCWVLNKYDQLWGLYEKYGNIALCKESYLRGKDPQYDVLIIYDYYIE